jgi:ferrous iron transport protein B
MNAEMKSKKWLWAGVGLQLSVGYSLGFLVYFFGTLITGGSFGAVWMPVLGWAVMAVIAVFVAVLTLRNRRNSGASKA